MSSELQERVNSDTWTHYRLGRGGVVITARGNEAIQQNPDLLHIAHEYRMSQLGSAVSRYAGVRSQFTHGGNSDIYHLAENSGILVKEGTSGRSLYFAMQRMDTLKTIVEYGVPRWIDVPDHLALVDSADLSRQYLFMQKIDSGITVQDVVDYQRGDSDLDDRVTGALGNVSALDKAEIQGRYRIAENSLQGFMTENGIDPSDYLTDWHEGNVLVERLRIPVADSQFKLWVIDQ